MNELPATSPHGIGALIAVVGWVALTFWATRPGTKRRWQGRRWMVVTPIGVVLLMAGVFGNGPFGAAGRGLITGSFCLMQNPTPRGPEAMDAALEVGLSDAFLHYYSELYGKALSLSGPELKSTLTFKRLPYRRLAEMGMTMSPAPPLDRTFILYEYYDVDNYAFHVLEGCTHPVSPRHEYLQLLVHNFAEELQLLFLLRMAQTDEERIQALKWMRGGVPTAAEWMKRELIAFENKTNPTDAVVVALAATLGYVDTYIDDPTKRGLPASTRVQLD